MVIQNDYDILQGMVIHPSSSETSECLSTIGISAVELGPVIIASELSTPLTSPLSSEVSYRGKGSSATRPSKEVTGFERVLASVLFSFTVGSSGGAGWVDRSRKFIA